MNEAVPWYTSPVQKAQITAAVSAFLALSPKVGNWLGWKTPIDVQVGMETVFGFITFIAPIMGSLWRAKSALQPLTLTQAKADAHPATIAAVSSTTQGPVHAQPPPNAPAPAGAAVPTDTH